MSRLLNVIHDETRARENCIVPINPVTGNRKNQYEGGKVKLSPEGVVVIETGAGWVLSGSIACKDGFDPDRVNNLVHMLHIECSVNNGVQSLENELQKFWELESIGILKNEKSYYDEFADNISKTIENRYDVSLLFKENHPNLPDNLQFNKQCLLKLDDKSEELF